MKTFFTFFQIILSILLITAILLQSKGTGLGSAWGGSGEFYQTKRGVEKILFSTTIVLVILFIFTSILGLIIK